MIPRHTQRGATLLVALVMLVVLTLLVISAIRSASTNLRISGNMQMQGEATAAAQQAIEQVISSDFTGDLALSEFPKDIPVDINNDGVNDYSANVEIPTCSGSVPLMNTDLNNTNPVDAPCFSSSTASNTGLISASGVPIATSQSWCYAQQWDVGANATSLSGSGADVTAHQGVFLRVPAGTVCD